MSDTALMSFKGVDETRLDVTGTHQMATPLVFARSSRLLSSTFLMNSEFRNDGVTSSKAAAADERALSICLAQSSPMGIFPSDQMLIDPCSTAGASMVTNRFSHAASSCA